MSKPDLIKRSGWLFIAGSLAFITILTGSDPIAIPVSVVSAILLAVAMSSLRKGYGERIGRFGGNMLLLGMSGPALWVIGIVFMAIMGVEAVGKGLWILLFVAPAISLLGLALFGLAALSSKPMARFNWLPVFAGIWYPVFYIFLAGYLFTHHGAYPGQYQAVFNMSHLIQFLALCVFGASLVSNASQEMATAS